MTDEKNDSERSNSPAPPTWRQAVVFSMLALVMLAALVYCDWPFVNDTGARIETGLRAVVWMYMFGLCALSIRLAVKGYKAHRERHDLTQSRLCIFAMVTGAVAAVVVYLVYSQVWTL